MEELPANGRSLLSHLMATSRNHPHRRHGPCISRMRLSPSLHCTTCLTIRKRTVSLGCSIFGTTSTVCRAVPNPKVSVCCSSGNRTRPMSDNNWQQRRGAATSVPTSRCVRGRSAKATTTGPSTVPEEVTVTTTTSGDLSLLVLVVVDRSEDYRNLLSTKTRTTSTAVCHNVPDRHEGRCETACPTTAHAHCISEQ